MGGKIKYLVCCSVTCTSLLSATRIQAVRFRSFLFRSLSPSSSLPTNPYNHQPQHRRRKKKTASTLLQKEVIGIVEDEDWASSSGGASNSEIYLQDANDEEEHYCISGSISNLQFSKAVSKAIWNDEIGMAAVVEKKGKIWITTGVVRNSKTYCSIEETLYATY
uniref:tRNA-splicing endonuclease subunit Sen54 N-terminal domain-containing protein n=1 Tax=Vitis vinifera TaxID=29760 RepID=F6HKU8_VITVI